MGCHVVKEFESLRYLEVIGRCFDILTYDLSKVFQAPQMNRMGFAGCKTCGLDRRLISSDVLVVIDRLG